MVDFDVIWDDDDDPAGNVQHIAEHDLTMDEAEDVLLDPDNIVDSSRSSDRRITFGLTSTGRHIAVVWEVVNDDPRLVMVRTAYECEPRGKR